MDANAIATGHYASTTFGDFLEYHDPVAGTLLCVSRLFEMGSVVLLNTMARVHERPPLFGEVSANFRTYNYGFV
jgi:hypothetical protein